MNNLQIPKPIVHTKRYRQLDIEDILNDEFLVIPDKASEKRGKLDLWNTIIESNSRNTLLISDIQKDRINISINGSEKTSVLLSNNTEIRKLISNKKILIDISGLPHQVWVPILKAAFEEKINARVLYAEPESYNPHTSPASDTLFDLSIKFEGLSPLPGFAQLAGPMDDDKCLYIPLLGFEGNRPQCLADQIDPPPKVIPIVGVPGFQVEFPTFTVTCNKGILDDFHAHSDIRYSRASCPFETYKVLEEIKRDNPDYYMYIAPVGTKPHGLGAILFALSNPEDTEIMFDHPVRKPGRTKGISTIHIYDLGTFNDF